MRPLRAFLYTRSSEGAWVVTVFRDWEPLESALHAGFQIDCTSKLLHVGFNRPETNELLNITKEITGQVLFSASALFATPIKISASASPLFNIGDLPIYLCLSGFGYSISDPTISSAPLSSSGHQKSIVSPPLHPVSELIVSQRKRIDKNWIQWTSIQRQDLASILEQNQITNDDEFLQNEINIEQIEIRLELAMIRFRLLTGENPNAIDFIDKLYATPFWFLNLTIEDISLTVRQINVFKAHEILTIQAIEKKGSVGLLKLPNMGKRSVSELSKSLFDAFTNGVGLTIAELPGVQIQDLPDIARKDSNSIFDRQYQSHTPLVEYSSFSQGMNATLSRINPEDRKVLEARIGYRCQRKTLQQIAETTGLTRERMRQVVLKVFRQISKSPFWEHLEHRIKQLLLERDSPLLVGGLSAIDTWFDNTIDFENPLKEICSGVLARRFSVFKIRDVAVLTELTQDEWETVVSNAKATLETIIGTDVTKTQAQSIILNLLPDRGKELRHDLWYEVTLDAKWSKNSAGDETLVGFGNDIETVILTILNSSELPLHTAEITRRVRSFGIANHDEHYIRNSAQKVAYLFNRGTYGLLKHVPLSDDKMSIIRSEVEEIISEGEPTRQWHTSELLDILEERGLDFDNVLTKYLINIALRESTSLSYLRRMVWGLSQHWANNANERLDLRQAIISLLESEGRPMSSSEIRARLTQDRGVGAHFQIHSIPPLISISPSVFGLDYRDVDYEKIHPYVDKLKEFLKNKNEGLHVTEVAEALGISDSADESFCSTLVMVGLRHGIKKDKSQYIYLEEWPNSRRIPINVAFTQAVKEFGSNGLNSQQIFKRICEITNRKITSNFVSHMLREKNFVWDETQGLWFEGLDQEDDE